MTNRTLPLAAVALLAVVAATAWACWPALTGPFLFDDFSNLNALAAFNDGFSPAAWREFFLHGMAGPSGRPLSLLSFLIDDWGWPSSPWSFKYTNLCLHILNGLLLFAVAWRLVLRLYPDRAHGWFPALVLAAFWLLNPYQVSSVMYVVQRMAMLAATAVLAGLWIYLIGRQWLEQGRRGAGYALILCAYGVGAGVGVLFKENAALFVLLVAVVELCCFRSARPFLLRMILILPAGLFVLGLALQWPSMAEQYAGFRDFSLGERLLTQARAVGYYLWRYLVPGVSYVGVFGDGFAKSTTLLSPPSTLVWLIAHAALLVAAVTLRGRWPLFTLAVGFFYVGHVMESSVVPLELFFEHRNYLPSALLLAPLLGLATDRRVVAVALAVLAVFVLLLRLQAGFWGDEHRLKVVLAVENPASERAIISLAQYVLRTQGDAVALEVLEHYPGQPGIELAVNRMALRCRLGIDDESAVAELLASPAKYRAKGSTVTEAVGRLSRLVASGTCVTLELVDLERFLDNYLQAFPRDGQGRQAYHTGLAYIAHEYGNYEGFRDSLLAALREWPNRELTLGACGQLGALGHGDDACACLAEFGHAFEGNRNTDRSVLRTALGYGQGLRDRFRDMYRMCE